ncbi:MAG: hypothetical protein E7020_07010 [Alphaproteobacteria bacterium]|nr:hypothetical protein [Alphaproteobacteria bacterium]
MFSQVNRKKIKYIKHKIIYLVTHSTKSKEKYKKAKMWLKTYYNFKNSFSKNTFFVIGDSHTDIFSSNQFEKKILLGFKELKSNLWGSVYSAPEFVTYHLDACLAYNINKTNTTMKGHEKVDYLIKNKYLPKGCKVITSFGEIDCRVHIKKQAEKQNKTIDDVIDDVIEQYGNFLISLQNKGYNVIAYAPIASQKENIDIDPMFPRYGNEIERNKISLRFGNKLQMFCNKNKIKFISLLNDLVNNDLTTKSEFYRDGVHLNMDARPIIIEKVKRL